MPNASNYHKILTKFSEKNIILWIIVLIRLNLLILDRLQLTFFIVQLFYLFVSIFWRLEVEKRF